MRRSFIVFREVGWRGLLTGSRGFSGSVQGLQYRRVLPTQAIAFACRRPQRTHGAFDIGFWVKIGSG
jgi:hypothetical protein